MAWTQPSQIHGTNSIKRRTSHSVPCAVAHGLDSTLILLNVAATSLLQRKYFIISPHLILLPEFSHMNPHEEFNTNGPVGYLISFRCYGTWLHGDPRGSTDRIHNRYGAPRIQPNPRRVKYEQSLLKSPPVRLTSRRRHVVEHAINETCRIRKWTLWAINVRTNHVQTVVTSRKKPELVLNAFKANATRELREAGCWEHEHSPWADRGSKIWLWNERELNNAIDYVLYEQGDPLP